MNAELMERPQAAAASVDRRRILVVEDDQDQRAMLCIQLGGQGFEVLTAGDCHTALEKHGHYRPDLVLVDVGLPDVSGWEVCRQLLEGDDGELPVIVLSGNDHVQAVRRSRSLGCRYFVRKPYDPNALLVLIENALGERLP